MLSSRNTMETKLLAQEIIAQELAQIHMGWSDWSSWSMCSTTCGEGEMLRSRTCTGPCLLNENGAHEAKACNVASCQGIYRSDPLFGGYYSSFLFQ